MALEEGSKHPHSNSRECGPHGSDHMWRNIVGLSLSWKTVRRWFTSMWSLHYGRWVPYGPRAVVIHLVSYGRRCYGNECLHQRTPGEVALLLGGLLSAWAQLSNVVLGFHSCMVTVPRARLLVSMSMCLWILFYIWGLCKAALWLILLRYVYGWKWKVYVYVNSYPACSCPNQLVSRSS